jgi:HEAT repeat protein
MVLAAALLVLGTRAGTASAHWRIGIGIGFPIYAGPYPCYPYYPYYYPAPVVVQAAPVVVQAAPVAAPPLAAAPAPTNSAPTAAPTATARAPEPAPAPALRPVATDDRQAAIDARLAHLANPRPQAWADAAMDLGRMKADQAVGTLTQMLANDTDPAVREATARALGLIGSARALPALQQAAQADADRDVRTSARFAVDVIQANR